MRNFGFCFIFAAAAFLAGCGSIQKSSTPPVEPGKLTISTTSLPGGTVGVAYSAAITATGGTTPYIYSATGLPSNLSINSSTGAITGTPAQSAVGTSTVAIVVTDAGNPTQQTATANLSMTVSQTQTSKLTITTTSLAGGTVGVAYSSAITATGGTTPYTYSAIGLPSNLLINSSTGAITGTPAQSAVGTSSVAIEVTDSTQPSAQSATANLSITVDQPTVGFACSGMSTGENASLNVAYAPFPAAAPIEGAPVDCNGWPDTYTGDAHVLLLDRKTCMLYETFNTHRCSGAWNSSSETIWDMTSGEQRPWGWTSADAAGLAIFPGLVRYDEVAAGAINHAIRFTMQHTKNNANGGYFVEPASHAAGDIWGTYNVMGMRIRLKAGFDISSYSAANKVILTAMKKYGMILADNGGYFYFQGVPDTRWDDDDLINLDSIQSSNFEVVQMTPVFPGWDSSTAPTGAPPTINSFTASALAVASGTSVTLTWDTSNDSYDFIDKLGGVHGGSVTITPAATTTYTLNATNQYGRSTKQVTVTVH